MHIPSTWLTSKKFKWKLWHMEYLSTHVVLYVMTVRLYSVSKNASVHRQLMQNFGCDTIDSTSIYRINKQCDDMGSVLPKTSPGRLKKTSHRFCNNWLEIFRSQWEECSWLPISAEHSFKGFCVMWMLSHMHTEIDSSSKPYSQDHNYSLMKQHLTSLVQWIVTTAFSDL